MTDEENHPENERPCRTLRQEDQNLSTYALKDVPREIPDQEHNRNPVVVRDIFAEYFHHEGAV